MTESFIRNVLAVEVDEIAKTNRYTAKSLWSVGSETKTREIEDLTMTWEEVEHEGGAEAVWADFEGCYKKKAPPENDEIFLENTLDIDNDGLKHVITYRVSALYDVKQIAPDGYEYYTLKMRTIEEFSLTWEEIEKQGFHHDITNRLNEKYNIKRNNI